MGKDVTDVGNQVNDITEWAQRLRAVTSSSSSSAADVGAEGPEDDWVGCGVEEEETLDKERLYPH